MLVYYFVPFIVSNLYLLFWVSNGHNSVTVQNRTHVFMNFFDHKDLGNHLLQLCPKVVNTLYILACLSDSQLKLEVKEIELHGWAYFVLCTNYWTGRMNVKSDGWYKCAGCSTYVLPGCSMLLNEPFLVESALPTYAQVVGLYIVTCISAL